MGHASTQARRRQGRMADAIIQLQASKDTVRGKTGTLSPPRGGGNERKSET